MIADGHVCLWQAMIGKEPLQQFVRLRIAVVGKIASDDERLCIGMLRLDIGEAFAQAGFRVEALEHPSGSNKMWVRNLDDFDHLCRGVEGLKDAGAASGPKLIRSSQPDAASCLVERVIGLEMMG
jgi:hypothetical protein